MILLKIIITVILLLSRQGLSPPTRIEKNVEITNQQSNESYNICMDQITAVFGARRIKCVERVRIAIMELHIKDHLPKYTKYYYDMIAQNIDETYIPTIKEECDSWPESIEKEYCNVLLTEIIKQITKEPGKKEFNENSKLDCLLAGLHYLRASDVNKAGNKFLTRFFFDIVSRVDIIKNKFLAPYKFCEKFKKQGIPDIPEIGECSTSANDPDTVLRL